VQYIVRYNILRKGKKAKEGKYNNKGKCYIFGIGIIGSIVDSISLCDEEK
jgi:hypothetical protein